MSVRFSWILWLIYFMETSVFVSLKCLAGTKGGYAVEPADVTSGRKKNCVACSSIITRVCYLCGSGTSRSGYSRPLAHRKRAGNAWCRIVSGKCRRQEELPGQVYRSLPAFNAFTTAAACKPAGSASWRNS